MNDVTFQRKLVSVMKDNKYDRFVGRKRSGLLDTKGLYRASTSSRVFMKREERKGKNYNVSILVDASGSMVGDKCSSAERAVQMLHDSFLKAGVNHEIHAFNTALYPMKSFSESKPKDFDGELENLMESGEPDGCYYFEVEHSPYNTVEIYLGTERPELEKDDDNYKARSCAAGNFDGYYVHQVTQRLRRMKGTNILIVLSDGEPHHDYGDYIIPKSGGKQYERDYPLNKVVDEAINDGIVFIGIGIKSESVKEYYPKRNTAVVHDLDTLYETIIGKFDALLKRA